MPCASMLDGFLCFSDGEDQKCLSRMFLADPSQYGFRNPAAVMGHATAMVGDPGPVRDLPDIAALLPEGGGEGAKAAAADCTLA